MERRREVMVGLVVMLGIAVGVVGTIWLQGAWGRDQVSLRAASTSVGQLVEGASVKFRGVAVGRVESVEVVPSGEAVLIDMSVRPDLVIPADAAVLIAPESMFGDWQAEIIRRDEYDTHPYLEHLEDGVLPGVALPDFSRLTATADEIAQNLTTISERFEIAFTEETAQNLGRAIDNLGEISDRFDEIINQQAERFDALTEGVDASTRELGAAARAARMSFERVDAIIADGQVQQLFTDAGAGLENLRNLTGRMDASLADLQSAARQADATFARLDGLFAAFEDEEGSLGRLLADPSLAEGAMDAVAELRTLLEDIRQHPRRYLSFSIF